MKNLLLPAITAILCFNICVAQQPAGLPPYKPASQSLHDTIAQLDSILFGAYNNCKVDVFASYIPNDLEFYHDVGGLNTSRQSVVDAMHKYICGKTRRELLPGSLEVYPIPGYGAVQMGVHRFHNLQEKSTSRYAKFVHTWRREGDKWQLARIISLH